MTISTRYLSHAQAADFRGPSTSDLSGFYWTSSTDSDLDPQGPFASELAARIDGEQNATDEPDTTGNTAGSLASYVTAEDSALDRKFCRGCGWRFCDVVEDAPRHQGEERMFLVRGWHHHIPGEPTTLHRTRESADREAVKIVTLLCKELKVKPPEAPYMEWEPALARVQRKLGKSALYSEDSAGVEVIEMEVQE